MNAKYDLKYYVVMQIFGNTKYLQLRIANVFIRIEFDIYKYINNETYNLNKMIY